MQKFITFYRTQNQKKKEKVTKMFDKTKFTGMLIKGELREAVKYLKDFPEKKELYDRYLWVFENENYPIATENGFLNDILTAYRKYYRQVFYLKTEKKTAEEN